MSQEPPKSSWGLWSIVESVTTTVKQKSDEIINIYKEDLQEFSRTIVSDTSAVIKEKVAALNLDGNEQKRKSTQHHNPHQSRILRIQRDSKTYTESPTDEGYEAWATAFNVGAPDNTEAITQILTSNEHVREFHTSLVPAKVSYRDFWCRYYYRMNKLEEEDKRRNAILKNANANDDEEFSWDVEDDTNKQNRTPSPSLTKPPSDSSDPSPVTPPSSKSPELVSTPTLPHTPPPTPASEFDSPADHLPRGKEEIIPATPPATRQTPTTPPISKHTPATPTTTQTQDIPDLAPSEELDELDQEIAKKSTELQKMASPPPQKLDTKSDAEEGWADWE